MAKVPNGVETLPKILIAWVFMHERYRQQTDRRQTDGRRRSRSLKTRERICTRNGSKRVKSAKDVPFGGFVKNGHPLPH